MDERYRGFWRVAGLAGIAGALCAGADAGGNTPAGDGPVPVVALAAGVPEMKASSYLASAGVNWMVPYIGYEPVVEVEPPSAPSYGGGVVVAAEHLESEWPAQLSRDDLERVYDLAGVPVEWREPLAQISWCESRWRPGAVGDGGASLGLHQINWETWFPYSLRLGLVEESDSRRWSDPVTNTKVALGVVRYDDSRGYPRWKQWTCQP